MHVDRFAKCFLNHCYYLKLFFFTSTVYFNSILTLELYTLALDCKILNYISKDIYLGSCTNAHELETNNKGGLWPTCCYLWDDTCVRLWNFTTFLLIIPVHSVSVPSPPSPHSYCRMFLDDQQCVSMSLHFLTQDVNNH